MTTSQFIEAHFRDNPSTEIFPRPPLLTSCASDWENIYLEHHQQTEMDTSEVYNCNHIIFINLSRQSRQGDIWLNGQFQKAILPQPGVITVKPSGATHRFAGKDASEFIVVEFKPKFIASIGQNWTDSEQIELIPHFYPQGALLLFQLGLALKAELESGCLGGKIYGDSIATTMAAHLLRNYSTFKTPTPKNYRGLAPAKLENVIDYIQTYLDLNLGLEELANLSDLSPYYFSRLFKESTSTTPYQYISQQRMERAKQLLEDTDIAVAEIALRCGFSSQSSFATAFRKAVGVTPRVYRQSF